MRLLTVRIDSRATGAVTDDSELQEITGNELRLVCGGVVFGVCGQEARLLSGRGRNRKKGPEVVLVLVAIPDLDFFGPGADGLTEASWLGKGLCVDVNDIAQWLVLQPECPLLCEAGAHLILAHAPETAAMQLDHAEHALRVYREVSVDTPATSPSRKYLDWALQRATRLHDQIKQQVLAAASTMDRIVEPVSNAIYKEMCAEHVDAFWDRELGTVGKGPLVKEG
ncbi:hypothetical protein MN608_09472 [Microdochium nivale]|nr:hypothetical protein MN608_09472 [Microdochium nivale]